MKTQHFTSHENIDQWENSISRHMTILTNERAALTSHKTLLTNENTAPSGVTISERNNRDGSSSRWVQWHLNSGGVNISLLLQNEDMKMDKVGWWGTNGNKAFNVRWLYWPIRTQYVVMTNQNTIMSEKGSDESIETDNQSNEERDNKGSILLQVWLIH